MTDNHYTMEKINLSIEGFKCFRERTEFTLNNLTLLTGANSAGKSTVVQSLLLNKMISEFNSDNLNQLLDLDLNNKEYALELGTYDDIVNHEVDYHNEFQNSNDIVFTINEAKIKIRPDDNLEAGKSVKVLVEKVDENFNLCCDNFVYLNAYRMAPQYEYKNSQQSDFCDCHGTNTGNVIQKHSNDNCDKIRSLDFSEGNKWTIQLDKWISYIFPKVAIQILPSGNDSYQVKILGNAATNVGFGITYALPILVNGLLAPENGFLIVENPEAHLHAKAQSNIGYFLARMAAAGVRVIIETHSEHVVNGIRRMIVEGKTSMSHNDMTIYFFHNNEGKKSVQEIGMDDKGNLTEFPVDFFDQVRQDMLKLMELGRKHEN